MGALLLPDSMWLKVRAAPTSKSLWLEILKIYLNNQLTWQAAYVARQIARLDPSEIIFLDGLLGNISWSGESAADSELMNSSHRDVRARIDKFSEWLLTNPEDWLTWIFQTRLYDFIAPVDKNQSSAYLKAQSFEYIAGESAHLLGYWRFKAGDTQGALKAFLPLVDQLPMRHGSMMHLGEILLRLGNTAAAEKAFTRASHSNNPLFLRLLAGKVYANNYWKEAIEIIKKALTFDQKSQDLWYELAQIQYKAFLLTECKKSIEEIHRLGSHSGADMLSIALEGHLGDPKAYFNKLRAAYEQHGDENSRLISSILMCSLYQDDLTPVEISELHKHYCENFNNVASHAFLSADSTEGSKVQKNKVLRLGYVTGDLIRQHPVNLFMLPLLREQQHSSMEVYIYYTDSAFDGYTAQAKSYATNWVDAHEWDDAKLAKKISDDGVDILIDLAGHTSSHRLGVFIKRPAPINATFLGYPHSTGLTCMDYLIGDRVVSPPEHQNLFSESVLRIDGSVFCWAPIDYYPLPQNRSQDSIIMFGSFNNTLKLTAQCISVWSKILHAVPNSKLLIKSGSLVSSDIRSRFIELFNSCGIDRSRLEFRGPSELSGMMQEYGDIDIALDPLSYNGGTTSLQAMWMGVPLVTMCGGNFTSRMGASFLTVLGKSEWIASNESEYIEIAKEMARDVSGIRQGRACLRGLMASSLLCDIKAYASNFESLLHDMQRGRK